MKKSYLYVIVFVLLAGFAYQTFRVVQLNNELNQAYPAEQFCSDKHMKNLDQIRTIVSTGAANSTDIIHNTMKFIYENSTHDLVEEGINQSYMFESVESGIDHLIKAYNNPGYDKIMLSCGPRAMLMSYVLSYLSMDSRLVQVYSDENYSFAAHRLLEIYNPDTRRWELWDPDHQVTYIDRKTKQRIDGLKFVFSDKADILPVNGSIVGWEENQATNMKKGFDGAILYENQSVTEPGALFSVDSTLYDINKEIYNGRSLKDMLQDEYRHARLVMVNSKTFQ